MSQTHLTPHPPFDHFCIFMSTCRPMEVIPPFRHHQRWFDVLTWCPTKVVAVVSRWSPAPNAAARIGKMTMRDLECPVRWILITPCFSCLAWYKIRCSAPRLWLYNTLYRAGEGKAQNFGKPVCRMWNANMIWIIGQIKWNLICIQWNPLWEFILKVLVMLLVEPDKCQLLFFEYYAMPSIGIFDDGMWFVVDLRILIMSWFKHVQILSNTIVSAGHHDG